MDSDPTRLVSTPSHGHEHEHRNATQTPRSFHVKRARMDYLRNTGDGRVSRLHRCQNRIRQPAPQSQALNLGSALLAAAESRRTRGHVLELCPRKRRKNDRATNTRPPQCGRHPLGRSVGPLPATTLCLLDRCALQPTSASERRVLQPRVQTATATAIERGWIRTWIRRSGCTVRRSLQGSAAQR